MTECEKMGKSARIWPPPSQTGGVKAMSLQGRLYRERERLYGDGMTDEEREWRAQWKRDQILCDHEPVKVPEIYRRLNNPIKRLYRIPLNYFENALAKRIGEPKAHFCRVTLATTLMLTYGIYAAAYYFKYNTNDWTRKGGWRVVSSRKSVVPGDADWPYVPDRHEGADYNDRGFKQSTLFKEYLDLSFPQLISPETIEFLFAE